jgi:hypothetical protein
LTNRAGSRAGYVSANPDPYQNVTDPEHCHAEYPFVLRVVFPEDQANYDDACLAIKIYNTVHIRRPTGFSYFPLVPIRHGTNRVLHRTEVP